MNCNSEMILKHCILSLMREILLSVTHKLCMVIHLESFLLCIFACGMTQISGIGGKLFKKAKIWRVFCLLDLISSAINPSSAFSRADFKVTNKFAEKTLSQFLTLYMNEIVV